ncbi:MAG: hypothetical protein U9Q79_09555 [Candidatus Hydrogenedentes bacterium]|nr:hypothetical protein [Candidatus Hydrogenedentota bacterium]
MFGHPTKDELIQYAEALVDGKPLPARIGGHIASCPACKTQVETLRASFSFLAKAPTLECPPGSREQILTKARQVRKTRKGKRTFLRNTFVFTKGLACAACVVLVAAWVFSTALGEPDADQFSAAMRGADRIAADPVLPSAEELQRKATEIQSLASAVNAQSDAPVSLWERQHRHMVVALHTDRTAALAALKRNPGCARASRLATANLEREAQALRTLYVEQGR